MYLNHVVSPGQPWRAVVSLELYKHICFSHIVSPGPPWAALDSPGQPWAALGSPGQPWLGFELSPRNNPSDWSCVEFERSE